MRKPVLSETAEKLQSRLAAVNDQIRNLEVDHELRNETGYVTTEERQNLVTLKADAGRLNKAFEIELSLAGTKSLTYEAAV